MGAVMADSLKKGIGTKYLLPIIAVYAAGASALGVDRDALLQSVLQNLGIAGVAGVALLIFQDLLPRAVKEVLVFWRLRERPPGYRAFSEIAPKDARVDPIELAVLLPRPQLTGTEQNALWYRWLKSVEGDPAVADNHHRFLALRDCAVLLLLLALISLLGAIVLHKELRTGVVLSGVCFGLYLLAALAARNAAVRLVGNVIARKVATS